MAGISLTRPEVVHNETGSDDSDDVEFPDDTRARSTEEGPHRVKAHAGQQLEQIIVLKYRPGKNKYT
jgi:hypothetical protein